MKHPFIQFKRSRLSAGLIGLSLALPMAFTPQITNAYIWDDAIHVGKSVTDIGSSAYKKAKSAASSAAKIAGDSAVKAGTMAASADYDKVADIVIDAASNPAPFRNAVLDELSKLPPGKLGELSGSAAGVYKNIDDQYGEAKAATYKSLYKTYKGDLQELIRRAKEKDFDISEYRKYSLYYGIATADWSNPTKAATEIAKNQYTAFSFYSKHTLRGTATTETRNHIGLTNERIAEGLKELQEELKGINAGKAGLAIMSEFMGSARKSYIGPGEYLPSGSFIISDNGKYSVVFQKDGNLVYQGEIMFGLLSHNRHGDFGKYRAPRCIQQSDGNLVVYNGSSVVGATLAHGKAGGKYFTIVQNDGNVVTYPGTGPSDVHGPAIWSSGTVVK
ncbi:hypothetical protein [Pelodictyon luteolum]|uniref:Bulb-type lectin domain-containing protein n=1 Tax=Chlorobium luteolum (strain DSM 273 / BCRC 81028 / 2530) TaxID=319225 RepID=Q3B443_CHLL3|nr:hypothetical protein [Pelodictyon luteolum]ABB23888.1 hypothetical protein Plut_1026 [Pelodictyon luteolum DSM 273]